MKKRKVEDTEFIGYRNSAINQYVVNNDNDFKPSTFISSRSNRASAYSSSIKDYMDESDGILGGKLVVAKGIDSFESKKIVNKLENQNDNIDYLKYFCDTTSIRTEPSAIGIKLLSKMGWKEGQGIGPSLVTQIAIPNAKTDVFGIGYTFIQTSIIRSMDHDDDYDDDEVEDFVDSYINRTDYLKSEKQGFHLSRASKTIPPFYPLPEVPSGFSMYHIFPKEDEDKQLSSHISRIIKPNLTSLAAAKERTKLINIQDTNTTISTSSIETKSVFDLLKPADKDKINSIINMNNISNTTTSTIHTQQSINSTNKEDSTSSGTVIPPPPPQQQRPMLTSSAILNSTFSGLSQAFKNRFTTSSADNRDNNPLTMALKEGIISSSDFTATKATQNLTSHNFSDIKNAEIKLDNILPNQKHIRVTTSWVPVPLLCKRFNVKAPDTSTYIEQTNLLLRETSLLSTTTFNVNIDNKIKQVNNEVDVKLREEEQAMVDVYLQPSLTRTNKNALSEFKSIFEDSDSDDDDDDEIITTDQNENNNVIINNNNKKDNDINVVKSINQNVESTSSATNFVDSLEPMNVIKYISSQERNKTSNNTLQLSKVSNNKSAPIFSSFRNNNIKTKIQTTDDDDNFEDLVVSTATIISNNDDNINAKTLLKAQNKSLNQSKRKFILSFSHEGES